MIATGGEQFAIPQVNLLELVRLEGEQARHAVEHIHGTPVCRLRGNLLPLVFLAGELELEQPLDGWSAAGDDEDEAAVNVVVLQVADRTFGLVVDRVLETEEIVVKPLGEQLKDLPCFAGATIRGDGRVALILDILSLAQRAGVVSEVTERLLASSIEHARQVEAGFTAVKIKVGGADLATDIERESEVVDLLASYAEQATYAMTGLRW